MNKKIIIFASIFASFLTSNSALAGNMKSFFLGNDAAMTAGSISAVTRDSEAIWYNPAGMGGSKLTRLDLTGTAFMMRLQNIPDGMHVILPSGEKSQDVRGNEFMAVPSALSFMRFANDDISYGFGVYVPQYQDISLVGSLDSTENFAGIVEPCVYSQGFDYDVLGMEYNLGGAVGWQIRPDLRIGMGVFGTYERTRYNSSQFENIYSADGSGTTSLFYVQTNRALVSTIGVRGTLGAQWDISDKWKMGLVLFAPTFQVYSWGQASGIVAGTGKDLSGAIVSQADRVSTSISQWEGHMVEPFHQQISFALVKPDYWIGLTADFYLPLKEPTLLIDKRFAWNVSAGSKFKITEKINMGAGLFTDNSDERSPTTFGAGQVNYYGATFGAQFMTPISRSEGKEPVIFSMSLAGRYALGIGDVGGQIFNPSTDGNITMATIRSKSVYFNELSLYVGSSVAF